MIVMAGMIDRVKAMKEGVKENLKEDLPLEGGRHIFDIVEG